ncbi:MAG TPA: MBL fold metallo-hydrolase [Ktedonobacterales bacterium]|nr:MBL fold metallo-hydrolase [Ktedonobacterales bacterium]
MPSSEHASDAEQTPPEALIERVAVGQLEANCYLVTCPQARETLIVDPGAEAERILARVYALGTRVTGIAHTHGHFDHISATEAVQAGLPERVPVWAHPADLYLYDRRARALGVPYGYPLPADLSLPDERLTDDGALRVGRLRLTVIATPGHTPGSICLHLPGRWLLSGDTLFRRGIGRTDLPGGEEDAIYESILTRLYPLPDELAVYPGHGDETTIAEERHENPFVQAADG